MVLAEAQGVDRIFTSDHHFRQAGFSILMRVA
jgi:predicted nucleic acid-binding protein